MDAGCLVTDSVVTIMLGERLAEDDCVQRGWLLYGSLRTAAQSDVLYAAGVTRD